MRQSLGDTALFGAVLTGSTQIVRLILGMALIVITSRILAPDDFGLIAMITPITAFVALIPGLGLSQALIQAKELSRAQIQSAFWVSTALGLVCVVLLLGAAPFVGTFFEDSRASLLTIAASGTLFVTILSSVHAAVLGRELRFGVLSIADLLSSITLFVVTVAAAIALKNYWALWLGLFSSAAVTSIYYWAVSSWRPSTRPNFKASDSLWKFGSAVTGTNILNFLSRNVDNVLIGKFAGTEQLGFYDRSYRLMTLPLSSLTEPLGKVMLPVLAKLRDHPERYRAAFLKVAWIVMLATAPISIVIASASETVIALLLGERWTAARDIFFWLSVGAIYQPLSSITGWLFLSLGRGREMMFWAVISSTTTIASFVIGIRWGAEGVAMAYVLTSLARLPLLYAWTTRTTPVLQRDLYVVLLPTIVTGFAMVLIAIWSNGTVSLTDLLLRVAFAYAISFTVAFFVPVGREALTEAFRQLPGIVARFGGRNSKGDTQ